MLLTDGDIWSQQSMFDYLAEQTKNGDVRVFPIGIGGGVSSALIEGVARSGGGFAQMVANNEKLDSKIVRMVSIFEVCHCKVHSNLLHSLRVRSLLILVIIVWTSNTTMAPLSRLQNLFA